MKNSILLGIDTGFATLGYGAIALPPDINSPLVRVDFFGVFETEKESKKRNVLATEDNLRRARELTANLSGLIDQIEDDRNRLVAICAESMSWPRNASTSAKIGIGWGIIAALSQLRNIPIVQTSPQSLKKQLCGRRDANKEEVREAVLRVVTECGRRALQHSRVVTVGRHSPVPLLDVEKKIAKLKREHPWDALGLALVCRNAEVIQMARRVGSAGAAA